MMLDQANRTFICSVVFVDLVGYSKKSVAEQIAIKDRFTTVLSDALKRIVVNDRIILDTGDGAAMSFLGDPEDALFVAMSLRDSMGDTTLPLGTNTGSEEFDGLIRVGINLGPVKLVKDINGHPNIIGDGINVAQRIMSFARAGQIVVSRSYYDVVSCLSEEYAKLFTYEGARTDKHVREHEIYLVGKSESAFNTAKSGMENRAAHSGPEDTNPVMRPYSGTSSKSSAKRAAAAGLRHGFFADRTKVMVVGAALALVVMGLALQLVGRKDRRSAAITASQAPANQVEPDQEQAAASQAANPATGTTPPLTVASAGTENVKPAAALPAGSDSPSGTASPGTTATPAALAVAPDAARAAKADKPKSDLVKVESQNGSIALDIKPWGELFIDGKSRGISPPVKTLKLAPGKHKIEVRNTTFVPHLETIEIKPREEISIHHKFQ
jgi:class 3 adenylate cyclase